MVEAIIWDLVISEVLSQREQRKNSKREKIEDKEDGKDWKKVRDYLLMRNYLPYKNGKYTIESELSLWYDKEES